MKHLRSALGALALVAVAALAPTTGAQAAQPASPQTTIPAVDLSQLSALAAGNGTNNFYGSGSCGNNMPLGTWASLKFTNYDSGSNQIVHTNGSRSGAGIIFQVYINGVFRESGDLEDFYTVTGHSRVVVGLRSAPGPGTSNWYTCSDSYT